jgi:tetratricopeptide (TPR) repeat protein
VNSQSLRITALIVLGTLASFGEIAGVTPPNQAAGSAQAHISRASVLLRSRQFEKAREELEAAVKLNPALPQAHLYLGVVEGELGNLTLAVVHLREALRLDPKSDGAHYNLGLILVRTGKSEEAIRELQQAVKQNPALTDARYNLGVLLSGRAQFREAIGHLEAARKARPGDPAVVIHLARAYQQHERYAEPVTQFRERIESSIKAEPGWRALQS